ncbi:hypothetical protein COOONC_08455 [Cooperia oncophora]
MIGMVNVQCDSPIDFYAAAPVHLTPRNSRREINGRKQQLQYQFSNNNQAYHKERFRIEASYEANPVLLRRIVQRATSYKIEYSPDGRKMTDGVITEDEIQSPVDSYKTLESELAKLNVKGEGRPVTVPLPPTHLVSPNRIEGVEMQLEEEESSDRK